MENVKEIVKIGQKLTAHKGECIGSSLLSISHSPFATYANDHFDINRCIVKF